MDDGTGQVRSGQVRSAGRVGSGQHRTGQVMSGKSGKDRKSILIVEGAHPTVCVCVCVWWQSGGRKEERAGALVGSGHAQCGARIGRFTASKSNFLGSSMPAMSSNLRLPAPPSRRTCGRNERNAFCFSPILMCLSRACRGKLSCCSEETGKRKQRKAVRFLFFFLHVPSLV